MESDLILSLKSTRPLYCQPSCMHVRPGQYTNAMPRNLTPFPPKLPEETPENQVARQDPRYRGPEEGKYAKRTHSIEACTAKMNWPCHKNA